MAGFGRLPGVGLPPRRRSNHTHHHREGNQCLKPSMPTSMDLDDEAAHNARKRLEKRLGHFRPSSSAAVTIMPKCMCSIKFKAIRKVIMGVRSSSLSAEMNQINMTEVCAICLENFEAEEEAMELMITRAHKFHSHCLSPWLQAHPDCPYCRTNVFVCS